MRTLISTVVCVALLGGASTADAHIIHIIKAIKDKHHAKHDGLLEKIRHHHAMKPKHEHKHKHHHHGNGGAGGCPTCH